MTVRARGATDDDGRGRDRSHGHGPQPEAGPRPGRVLILVSERSAVKLLNQSKRFTNKAPFFIVLVTLWRLPSISVDSLTEGSNQEEFHLGKLHRGFHLAT